MATSDLERAAYRVDEVATLLGVSARTVRRWLAAGELRSVRLGGVVLIPTAELDTVLAPQREKEDGDGG